MAQVNMANVTSLEPYLNRRVLFVHGFPSGTAMSNVRDTLMRVCPPSMGRVDVLTHADGTTRGTAFCNFNFAHDAAAALEEFRFSLYYPANSDNLLKVFYASDRQYKDLVQGPPAAKFKVLVKNLPDEVEVETLYRQFMKYGEVLQCHLDYDDYQQPYFIAQYVMVSSVQEAVEKANRMRLDNHVLVVEPFAKRVQPARPAGGGTPTYAQAPPPQRQAGTFAAAQLQEARQQQQAAAARSSSVAAAGSGAASTSGSATPQQLPAGGAAPPQAKSINPLLDMYYQRGGASVPAAPAPAAPAEHQYHAPAPSSSFSGVPLPQPFPTATLYPATPAMPGFMPVPQPLPEQPAPAYAQQPSMRTAMAAMAQHMGTLGELLCCPITQELLTEPVVAADGNTYERLAIEAWLQQSDTSPLTNEALPHKGLVPNKLVKAIIDEYH